MSWFRRAREALEPPTEVAAPVESGDSPDDLRRTLAELVRYINRSSGHLPAEAVVHARRITDALGGIIDTSDARELDVYTVLSVQNTLTDYLPTTLRSYLAVDEHLLDSPRATGRTPRESLLEQLDALGTSASAMLVAARDQDADALITQGNFLRTKFSGSDLDL
jgi:hypothetical protein